MSGRRVFLAASAAVPALAAGAAAASTPDAALVAMAAELQSIDRAYNAGCGQSDDFCNSPQGEAMMERLEAIIDRMAELPADGLEGIAAKAGRLCASLDPRSGGSLMCCEAPLVASLAADLARLVPEAVGAQHPPVRGNRT
jgi:hypothetical protein